MANKITHTCKFSALVYFHARYKATMSQVLERMSLAYLSSSSNLDRVVRLLVCGYYFHGSICAMFYSPILNRKLSLCSV